MKTISSHVQTSIYNPHVDVAILGKITVRVLADDNDSSGISYRELYICDKRFEDANGVAYTDGTNVYNAMINRMGTLEYGGIDPISHRQKEPRLRLWLDNTVSVLGYSSFSSLVRNIGLHLCEVEIWEWHQGGTSVSDRFTIFKGMIDQIGSVSLSDIEILLKGYEGYLAKEFTHTIVNADDYPNADPDYLGRMLPVVYGECKRVPFVPVDAGWVTSLAEDITYDQTGNIEFTDVSGFPSSGTIQIGSEQMTYSSKSDGNNTLNISGRNTDSGGFGAQDHDAGELAGEIQTDYFYIMDHGVYEITDVYVAGVKQQSSIYTAYTGQSGDEHASYPGRACIQFTTLPIIRKQVNLDIEVTVQPVVTVTQQPGIQSSVSVQPITNMDEGILIEFKPTSHSGTGQNGAYAYDSNESTYCEIYNPSGTEYHYFEFTGDAATNRGSVSKHEWWVLAQTSAVGAVAVTNTDLDSLGSIPAGSSKGWFNFTDTDQAWGRGIRFDTDFNEQILIYEIYCITHYTPGLTRDTDTQISVVRTPDAVVTRTTDADIGLIEGSNSVADTVIGGEVTVDLIGYQDDALGTYTGWSEEPLYNAGSVSKHILLDRCGLSSDYIDDTFYTAAIRQLGFDSSFGVDYYANVVILAPPKSVKELLHKIAFQSQCYQWWEDGKHHILYDSGRTVDKTIQPNAVDSGTRDVVRFTLADHVENKFEVNYLKHWAQEYFSNTIAEKREIVTSDAADSQTKYGIRKSGITEFEFVSDSAQAGDVVNWIEEQRREVRIILKWKSGWFDCELHMCDIVEFTFESDSLLDKTFLGFVFPTTGVDAWMIINKVRTEIGYEFEAVAYSSTIPNVLLDNNNFPVLDSNDAYIVVDGV